MMENDVFCCGIPSLVLEMLKFLCKIDDLKLCNDLINPKIENISKNIGVMIFKLAPVMYIR